MKNLWFFVFDCVNCTLKSYYKDVFDTVYTKILRIFLCMRIIRLLVVHVCNLNNKPTISSDIFPFLSSLPEMTMYEFNLASNKLTSWGFNRRWNQVVSVLYKSMIEFSMTKNLLQNIIRHLLCFIQGFIFFFYYLFTFTSKLWLTKLPELAPL